MSTSPAAPPPGAKASKTCGSLAIAIAIASMVIPAAIALQIKVHGILVAIGLILSCLGILLALGLSIGALLLHRKARRWAKALLDADASIPATRRTYGILGLVLSLMAALIMFLAVLNLVSNRRPARDASSQANLESAEGILVGEYDRLVTTEATPDVIPHLLEIKLWGVGGPDRNPWDPSSPAFTNTIEVVDAPDLASIAEIARTRAVERGRTVFVISMPDPSRGRDGYLAGAVLLGEPLNGRRVITKVTMLPADLPSPRDK